VKTSKIAAMLLQKAIAQNYYEARKLPSKNGITKSGRFENKNGIEGRANCALET